MKKSFKYLFTEIYHNITDFAFSRYSCILKNNLILKQESPLAGNRKRRTAHGITSQSISYPRGGGGYLPWMGEGVPTLDGGGGTYLGLREGVSTLDGGT